MIEHNYAYMNSIRLHYVTSGNGKLILFVHGFPEFWYAWKDQLLEFGRDYQAVAPDMRGYNLSEKPVGVDQYQVKFLCEDLRSLAEHLGHKRFVLVGHDWGGAVAWAFALSHPEYLEKLVIINAPHPVVFERELRENPAQQKASEYMLMFRSPEAEQILSANQYDSLYKGVVSEGIKNGYFTEQDCKAYLEAWSQPGALTGGLNYYRVAHIGPPTAEGGPAKGKFVADLSEVTVKVQTLVIWGEKDPYLLTGNLEGLEELVPGLTIKRIPDGSHWVVHEKPALINNLIRAFIRN
jgi:pimeloyl-ACP methyl ester carboxylesterase